MSDRGEIKISDTKACPLQKKDRYKCNYIQQRSREIVIHLLYTTTIYFQEDGRVNHMQTGCVV